MHSVSHRCTTRLKAGAHPRVAGGLLGGAVCEYRPSRSAVGPTAVGMEDTGHGGTGTRPRAAQAGSEVVVPITSLAPHELR